MLKRKKVKPITLRDVTIIDDGKLRKAITAASLGNAMEWFDFGVYGFVAYALGKVFFPVRQNHRLDPSHHPALAGCENDPRRKLSED